MNHETTPHFEDDALRTLGFKKFQSDIDDYAESVKREGQTDARRPKRTSPTNGKYRPVENIPLPPDQPYL